MAISFLKCVAEACTNVVTKPSLLAFAGGLSLGLKAALGLVERTTQVAANTLTRNRDIVPPETEAADMLNSLIATAREVSDIAKETKMLTYFPTPICWFNSAIYCLNYPYSTAVTSAICAATGCFLGVGAALLVAEKGTQRLANRFIRIRNSVPRTPADLAATNLLINLIQTTANTFKEVKQKALTATALFGTALCLGMGISNGCSPFSLASRNFSSIGKKVLN